jgi:hypothetical protein
MTITLALPSSYDINNFTLWQSDLCLVDEDDGKAEGRLVDTL